jgi:hypothetical protein
VRPSHVIETHLSVVRYPVPFFLMPIARETFGVLLELPTDEHSRNALSQKVTLLCWHCRSGSHPSLPYCSNRMQSARRKRKNVSVLWDAGCHDLSRSGQRHFRRSRGHPGASCPEAYNIKVSDNGFIHAIAGRTGLLHAQLARKRGATVIGATSTAKKAG